MDTKEFIQGIITNELTGCFADCSQDNIDKLVDILNRHHEHQAKDNKVLSGVVKRLWNKLTIIIIYVPSMLIDYLISLTTDESYSDARKTTIRSFKRVWYNK